MAIREETALLLDIGKSRLRWCVVTRQSGELILSEVNSAVLPPDETERSAAVQNALSEALRSSGVAQPTILTALPKSHVFLRVIEAPAVSRHDLEKILSLRVAQEVPNFSPESVKWAFETIETPSGRRSVVLSAIRKEALESFLSDFRAIGLEPDVVDIEPLALSRWFAHHHYGMQSVAIADVGHQNTSLILFKDGAIRAINQLPLSYADAMDKSGMGVSRFATEIHSAIQSAGESDAATPPILLCGDGRATRYLAQSSSSEMSVEIFEDYLSRTRTHTLIPPARLDGNSHILESLAWRLRQKPAGLLNFVAKKRWSASAKTQAAFDRLLSIPTMAAITLALVAFFYVATNWMREHRTLALQQSLAQIHPLEPQLLRMEQTLNVLKAYEKDRFNWLEILSEINKIKPQNMMLAQLKMDRSGKCSMQGEINGKTPIQIAEQFVSALNQSSLFEQAQMGSIRSKQDSASFQVGFSISKTRPKKD